MNKIFLTILLTTGLLSASEIKIAENGKACVGILIPPNPRPIVKVAASELAMYLKKITGADFTIDEKSTFKKNIRLGFYKPDEVKNIDFFIRSTEKGIDISGADTDSTKSSWFYYYYDCDEKGTLIGVYYFLEKLGVRWPTPADEFIPEQKTLTAKDLNIRFKSELPFRQTPTSPYRFISWPDGREYVSDNNDFMRWLVRLGGSTRSYVAGVHSETPLGFCRDPQWLADKTRLQMQKNGERNKNYTCWTHPDVTKAWTRAADGYFSGLTPVQAGFKYASPGYLDSSWPFPFFIKDEFMIEPKDNDFTNSGKCYCERCQAFRKKHPCKDESEIMWRVIADVARNIKAKHPGKYITTLIYPPKMEIPKIDLPNNIKVKICASGPKRILDPRKFEKELKDIGDWQKKTGNGVSLYTYHCICHGLGMSQLVEYYPALIKKYAQSIRGKAPGMFMESKDYNFTRMLPDIYFFHRFMREPDLDLDKEVDEYYRLLYGPAHEEGKSFWKLLENVFAAFWKKTAENDNHSLVTPWSRTKRSEHVKVLWEQFYTADLLADLGQLISSMEKKCAGTKYEKNVRLLKKYVYDGLVSERNLEVNRDEIRKNLVVNGTTVKSCPVDAEWKNIPSNKLIAMKKYVELKASGFFRIAADATNVYLRSEFAEPYMQTRQNRIRRSGNGAVWKDDCAELYFYSQKAGKLWHILINSRGAWASRIYDIKTKKWTWKMIPGAVMKISQLKRSWILNCNIPLEQIAPEGGVLKFNIIRERRNKKIPAQETSTFSPLISYYARFDFENFAQLIFSGPSGKQ